MRADNYYMETNHTHNGYTIYFNKWSRENARFEVIHPGGIVSAFASLDAAIADANSRENAAATPFVNRVTLTPEQQARADWDTEMGTD